MLDQVIEEVRAEVQRIDDRYGPPASTHECLGVILEEFDELRHAIHANKLAGVLMEATQVAACAIRLAAACELALITETNFGMRSVP